MMEYKIGMCSVQWHSLQVYNTATDVWAFGVTVWEILTYGEVNK